MKSILNAVHGGGAFITETNVIKIKEKHEIKEKSPKRILPPLKEEKKEQVIITEDEIKKVKKLKK